MSQIPSRAVLRTKPLSEKEIAAALKEIAEVPISDHSRTLIGVLLESRSEELCDPAALRSKLTSIAAELARALKLWNSGDTKECTLVAHDCQNEIFDLLPTDPADPLYCHAVLTHHIESELQTNGLTVGMHKAAITRMVGAIDVPNLDAAADPRLEELIHIRAVILQQAFENLIEFGNAAAGSSAQRTEATRLLKAALAALKEKSKKQS